MKMITLAIAMLALSMAGVSQTLTAPSFGTLNGELNPMDYGAKCDGSTDDTAAFKAAIKAAFLGTHPYSMVIPATGSPCVVSQLDLTNINNRIHIRGLSSILAFQSVISCNELSSNSGVCIDLTGSQYVELEHIRMQHGKHPPLAVIRMGKSSGGRGNNGNSQIIATHSIDVEAGGSYGVYNNGGELWSSNNDVFEGASVKNVVLSANATPAAGTPFASLTGKLAGMTGVYFNDDTFSGTGVLFDYGSGGTVEDVAFKGGYAQPASGQVFLSDAGRGAVRSLTFTGGFRAEPQGSRPQALVSFTQPAIQVAVNGTMYAAVVAPSGPELVFGSLAASEINLYPGDNPTSYPSTLLSCTVSTGSLLFDYADRSNHNLNISCPGLSYMYANSGTLMTSTLGAWNALPSFVLPDASGRVFITRNQTDGGGEADIINSQGGGSTGGFNFYNTSSTTIGAPVFTVTSTGGLATSSQSKFIAHGTTAMPTGSLTAGSCATATTVATAGVSNSMRLVWNLHTSPSGVAGYGRNPVVISAWLTSGNVNFMQCATAAVTPGDMAIDWTVF
jgi:hypothetical protein